MKTILVAVEQHDHIRSLLETTYLMAAQHGSHVEGISPRPIFTGFVGDAGMVAINEISDPRATEAAARQEFEAFLGPRGAASPGGPSFRWAEPEIAGAGLGEVARVYDVTLVGRATLGGTAPLMSTVEPLLFDSGRPILIAPPSPPKSFGRTALIAWNGSSEAARATAYAMPLLKQAERVVIVSVEGAMVNGPSGQQAARHLQHHGISAEIRHIEPGERPAGEAVLAEANSIGCDLMIKGAYTQSRLRQMFFGGQTRFLLANATVPLFMSH